MMKEYLKILGEWDKSGYMYYVKETLNNFIDRGGEVSIFHEDYKFEPKVNLYRVVKEMASISKEDLDKVHFEPPSEFTLKNGAEFYKLRVTESGEGVLVTVRVRAVNERAAELKIQDFLAKYAPEAKLL